MVVFHKAKSRRYCKCLFVHKVSARGGLRQYWTPFGTTGTIKEPFRWLKDVVKPCTHCRCIHSTFICLLIYPWQAPMHSWLTSWPLCPVDIILGQRDLHVQIWFLVDGDDLPSLKPAPPYGKGLVSLHNISCSRRMLLSHNEKYIYVCVYTVVAVRLLTRSVFSNTPTKSKVSKLATAQKQRGIYASTNGSITCSPSMCCQTAFKCIHYVQRALQDMSWYFNKQNNTTAYHLSDWKVSLIIPMPFMRMMLAC